MRPQRLPPAVVALLERLAKLLPPIGPEPRRRLVPAKVFRDLY